jgi:hypothetical protein
MDITKYKVTFFEYFVNTDKVTIQPSILVSGYSGLSGNFR